MDETEAQDKAEVLAWLDSGVEYCRRSKPATPPRHLVSYFAVVDGEYVLLVDHINAQLWLPTGGHVEPDEHPKTTVLREAKEELGITGEFLYDEPLFITITRTVGLTAGHEDVSIWYALKGNRESELSYDTSEFHAVKWFHKNDVPFARADKQMARFLSKLYSN